MSQEGALAGSNQDVKPRIKGLVTACNKQRFDLLLDMDVDLDHLYGDRRTDHVKDKVKGPRTGLRHGLRCCIGILGTGSRIQPNRKDRGKGKVSSKSPANGDSGPLSQP